jgi:hypothetical protein
MTKNSDRFLELSQQFERDIQNAINAWCDQVKMDGAPTFTILASMMATLKHQTEICQTCLAMARGPVTEVGAERAASLGDPAMVRLDVLIQSVLRRDADDLSKMRQERIREDVEAIVGINRPDA